jgi:hypothetical protein
MSGRLGTRLFIGVLLLMIASLSAGLVYPQDKSSQEKIQQIREFREKRDRFFMEHPRSPLDDSQRGNFKELAYYPIDLKYRFEGKIERYKYHIMNPKYYANFLTNKGVKKRYIRYGRFRFQINANEFVVQLYKSPGSDLEMEPMREDATWMRRSSCRVIERSSISIWLTTHPAFIMTSTSVSSLRRRIISTLKSKPGRGPSNSQGESIMRNISVI